MNSMQHPRSLIRSKTAAILVGSIAALLAVQSAQAASQVWDGGSVVDGSWSFPNWLGNPPAPGDTASTTNTDVATFNAAIANTWGLVGTPIVIDSGTQNIGGLAFDLLADNYFIGDTAGNSLLLSSGGTIQILNTLTATNAVETINAPLIIQGADGTYTFANNSATGAGVGAGTLNFGGLILGDAGGATVLMLSGSNANANTISGDIGNGGATTLGITKSGAGTWVLSGSKSFSGDVTLTGGTLRATTDAGALGTGALILNTAGTVLDLANDTGLNFARNTTVSANMQITSDRLASGTPGVTHTLGTLGIGAQTLTIGGGGNVTSGTAGVTFGAATLSASGAVFTVNNPGGGGTTRLTLASVAGSGNSFSVNGTGDTTISGVIGTGTGAVTKADNGTLTLNGGNTFSGGVTLNAGTITVGNAAAFGTGKLTVTSGTLNTASAFTHTNAVDLNGTLNVTGTNNFTFNTSTWTLLGPSAITVAGGRNLTFTTSTLNNNGNVLTIDGAGTITMGTNGNVLSGSGAVVKTGTGTVIVGVTGAGAATVNFTGQLTVAEGIYQTYHNGGTYGLGDSLLPVILGSNTKTGTLKMTRDNTQNATTKTFTLATGGTGEFQITDALYRFTISGVIDGTGNLLKSSLGDLRLSGTNTYNGTTTISGGTLSIGSNSATGSLNTSSTITNNGTLAFFRTNILTQGTDFATGVSGTGGMTQVGTGNTVLTGSNSYTGKTIVSAGTLSFDSIQNVSGGNSALGAPTTTPNGTIDIGATTFAGTLRYIGSGHNSNRAISMAGTTGGATLDASGSGALNLTSAAAIAGGSGLKTLTLTGANANDNTLAGIIQNNGGNTIVTKTGGGKWVLTGANTYQGGTTVNGGTLLWSGANNLPATGTLTVNAGGNFSLADGTQRTTSTAALSLAALSNLTFDWDAGAVDTLTSTGAATTVAGNVGISINPLNSPTGSGLTLISAPSGLGTATYFLAGNTNFTATLTPSATSLQIGGYAPATPLTSAYWLGNQVVGATGAMSLSLGTTSNWASDAGGTLAGGVVPGATTDVFFSTTAGATQQSSVSLGANLSVQSLTFNDSVAVTISGASNFLTLGTGGITVNSGAANPTISSGVVAGVAQNWTVASTKNLTVSGVVSGGTASPVTVNGAGTVTLSGANTHLGGFILDSGGTIAVGNASALGAKLKVNNGTLTTASAFTLTNPVELAGTLNVTGSNNLTFGTNAWALTSATGTIDIGTGRTLIVNSPFNIGSNTLTVQGVGTQLDLLADAGGRLSGNGALIKTGAVNMRMGNNNSTTTHPFTGSVSVKSGQLENPLTLTNISGYTLGDTGTTGTLYVAWLNQNLVTLGGDRNIALATGGTGAIRVNDGTQWRLSGVISGDGNLTTLSTGTTGVTLLAGNNLYTGTTTITSGTLQSAKNASLSTTPSIAINGSSSLAVNYGGGSDYTAAEVLTLLAKSTFNATATAFAFDTTNAIGTAAYGNNLTQPAGLRKVGTGTLALTGTNSYTGSTLVQAGTLLAKNSAALPNITTGTITVSNSGSILAINAGAGAPTEWSEAQIATLLADTNFTFTAGTIFGIDTSGGNFTYGKVIPNKTNMSLTKLGSNTLTLTAQNEYTGTTTLNAGTLLLNGGHNTLAVNKPMIINGGTLDLGTTNQYVSTLTGTGGVVTGTGGTLTIQQPGNSNVVFSGGLSVNGSASVALVRSTINNSTSQFNFSLTNVSNTTGTVTLIGGDHPNAQPSGLDKPVFNGIALKDGGRLTGVTGVTLNNGTLYLNNNASTTAFNGGTAETSNQDLTDRVNDAATVTLNGGRIHFLGRASTNSTEALGAVTASTGMSEIVATAGGTGTNSAEVTLASLTRADGATLQVDGTNLGTAGNGNGRIFVTAAMTGNLAEVGSGVGIIPGVYRSTPGNTNPLPVGYVGGQGFVPVGTAGGPTSYTGTLALAPADANAVNPSAYVVATGGQTINSLVQGGNITFAAATDRLTIASGMLIQNPDPKDVGTTAIRGEVTSGLSSGELFLIKHNGVGSGGTLGDNEFNAVVTDNGGTPVRLVMNNYSRSGLSNNNINLTANNTYTGGTVYSGGNELYLSATTAGHTPIPAATDPAKGLIIDNSTVTMRTNAQQIAATNIVTLNGGSLLTLVGANNTLAGLVFNSNGGRGQTPTVTGGTLLTITGNISSTPTNPSTTPLISVPVSLNGSAAHDITVASLPQGNFANTLTPLNGLTISSVISNGGFTKKGAGVLNLTGNNTFTGNLIVEDGVINVASVNIAGSAGPLGQTTNPIILGKTGGQTGTIEYTGATASSARPFTLATGGTGAFQVDTAANTLTLSGLINGGGGLTKMGPGTLALTFANTHSGTTLVSTGTLALGNLNAVQASTLNTGTVGAQTVTFTVVGTNTYNLGGLSGADDINAGANSLSVGANNTNATFTGNGIGATFTKVGTAVQDLNGASQNYGTLAVNDGTLNVNGTLGTGSSSVTVTDAGNSTKLRFGTVSQTLSSLTIGAGATVVFTSGTASGAFSGGGGKAGGFGGAASSFGGGATVPEPGTLGLLLVGALGVLNRRRRA